MSKVKAIFDRLWADYTTQNPSVQKVHDLFIEKGESVENDHIAFRTFDDPRVNIDVLARVFVEAGYVCKGDYHFETKRLYAKHFEMEGRPRVFISQLKSADFSPFLQETVKKLVDQIPEKLLKSDELIYSGTSWEKPSFEFYEKLREESEYAAWLYVNGFCANHFTVSVNALKHFESLESVNQLIKDNGFRINDSGGEIKGNPSELLEQSSIRAEMIEVDFVEGKKEIPGCYYEFARRYPDKSGKLYSGFIAKSAEKIFESTDKVS
ncbi:MAG: DUF1338 domain-containing protein [Bacteroidales bacterium]|nr:DUF1338 domain-containing protein [Bacteroidales bacterium]